MVFVLSAGVAYNYLKKWTTIATNAIELPHTSCNDASNRDCCAGAGCMRRSYRWSVSRVV